MASDVSRSAAGVLAILRGQDNRLAYRSATHAPLVLLLLIHLLLLSVSAAVHSPASDEVGHLPAGIAIWSEGRFDLYRVNPPLVKAAAALPFVATSVEIESLPYDPDPRARPEWSIGREFISDTGPEAFAIWMYARWACIPFSLLGMYLCFRWGSELFGRPAGLLAATLWCFSPTVIGNASMITPDIGATTLGLWAAYTFAHWLKGPTLSAAFVSGLAVGLAQLSKMSWIILFGLWPLVFAVRRMVGRRVGDGTKHSAAPIWQLALILFIGWDILNCAYLWQGTFTPLREYTFQSDVLVGHLNGDDSTGNRFAVGWLGRMPVPLPRDYVLGMDAQKRSFEVRRPGYLRGEFRVGGWWYYYLYALSVKVPLGTWVLFVVALALTCSHWYERRRRSAGEDGGRPEAVGLKPDPQASITWHDTFVLLTPAVAILVLVSANTGINRHMRYALPVLPFVFIWISQVACVFGRPVDSRETRAAGRTVESRSWIYPFWLRAVVAGALIWSVTSSMLVYPHSGSYFNELAGGPANGWKHLNSSNIDWGQGLLFLKKWLDEHPEARPLYLLYYGNFDPHVAGIEFELPLSSPDGYVPPTARRDKGRGPHVAVRNAGAGGSSGNSEAKPAGPVPGWHAVSVHMLAGSPAQVATPEGGQYFASMYGYSYYQEFEPVATASYCFRIYHITLEEANRVRRKMGWPELRRTEGPKVDGERLESDH